MGRNDEGQRPAAGKVVQMNFWKSKIIGGGQGVGSHPGLSKNQVEVGLFSVTGVGFSRRAGDKDREELKYAGIRTA